MTARRVLRPSIQIRVLGVAGNPLEDAIVRIDGGQPLRYDKRLRAYAIDAVQSDTFDIRVERTDLETQERQVTVGDRAMPITFVLGKPGLPHYYRGPVKVPFDLPAMIAISLKPKVDVLPPFLIQRARDFGLEQTHVPPHAAGQRVTVFRAPVNDPDSTIEFEREVLKADVLGKDVQRVGKVVRYDADSLSFLSNECVVKFKAGVDGRLQIEGRGLQVLRQLPYNDAFVVQASPQMISPELLAICNDWADSGVAIWAEPNLVSTVVLHQPPNDPRLPQQTHHNVIQSQGAWNIFQTAKTTQRVSHVFVAVTDVGFLATHEDLRDILVDPVNFSDILEPLLEHPHGTKTAGMIGAVVDNGIGVAGIAGFPDFCHVRPVQIPFDTDQDFAAMFLWCAGLPNGRNELETLATGSDVISNSWGLEDRALSGDMIDAFDQLAVARPNGLGCVVVFSTGNNNTDYTIRYPWATHPAVIAVGASTFGPNEQRVGSSNFGGSIDVCAPAGDGTPGQSTLSTSTSPSFDPAGDYEPFGQTSAACPQVAGVAALMLAVNPQLGAEDVRDILHTTAIKIDFTNTDPFGTYDANGHSQWYGYGRIDARAAVIAAQPVGAPPAPPVNVRIVT
jgi:subtilisin family serine protease